MNIEIILGVTMFTVVILALVAFISGRSQQAGVLWRRQY